MALERAVDRWVDWLFVQADDLCSRLLVHETAPGDSIRTRLLVLSLGVSFVGFKVAWILQMFGAIDMLPAKALLLSSAVALVGIILLRITQSTRLIGYFLIISIFVFSFYASSVEGGLIIWLIRSVMTTFIAIPLLGVESIALLWTIGPAGAALFVMWPATFGPTSSLYDMDLGVALRWMWSALWWTTTVGLWHVASQRRLKSQLEETGQAKTEFMTRMNHELRTPLAGVIGVLELLRKLEPTKEQKKLLKVAQSCSNNLMGVINDILDFSKLEAGKMRMESEVLDLRELVEQVVGMMSSIMYKKPISITTRFGNPLPRYVVSDGLRLRQVLVNLCTNAIKFTRQGEITVRVSMVSAEQKEAAVASAANRTSRATLTPGASQPRKRSSHPTFQANMFLKFSVKDTGIGLAPEEMSRLFQAFSQARDSVSREYGGSGLGLSICRQIIVQMGGDIVARSDGRGKGSIFTFFIPYDPTSIPMTTSSANTTASVDFFNSSRSSLGSSTLPVSSLTAGQAVNLPPPPLPQPPRTLVRKRSHNRRFSGSSTLPADGTTTIVSSSLSLSASASRPVVSTADTRHQSTSDYNICDSDGHEEATHDAISDEPTRRKGTSFAPPSRRRSCPDLGQSRPLDLLFFNLPWRYATATPVQSQSMFAGSLLDPSNVPWDLLKENPHPNENPTLSALLVDDNAVNQLVISKMMEKIGWSVHICGTGHDAEEAVKKNPTYDIILMDLQLPDQDGYETTCKIRTMGFVAPIIAVTAGTADMEKVSWCGMNSVLSKPLTLSSLRQATQTALYRFSAQQN